MGSSWSAELLCYSPTGWGYGRKEEASPLAMTTPFGVVIAQAGCLTMRPDQGVLALPGP